LDLFGVFGDRYSMYSYSGYSMNWVDGADGRSPRAGERDRLRSASRHRPANVSPTMGDLAQVFDRPGAPPGPTHEVGVVGHDRDGTGRSVRGGGHRRPVASALSRPGGHFVATRVPTTELVQDMRGEPFPQRLASIVRHMINEYRR
jgi:hypothetical protein